MRMHSMLTSTVIYDTTTQNEHMYYYNTNRSGYNLLQLAMFSIYYISS